MACSYGYICILTVFDISCILVFNWPHFVFKHLLVLICDHNDSTNSPRRHTLGSLKGGMETLRYWGIVWFGGIIQLKDPLFFSLGALWELIAQKGLSGPHRREAQGSTWLSYEPLPHPHFSHSSSISIVSLIELRCIFFFFKRREVIPMVRKKIEI